MTALAQKLLFALWTVLGAVLVFLSVTAKAADPIPDWTMLIVTAIGVTSIGSGVFFLWRTSTAHIRPAGAGRRASLAIEDTRFASDITWTPEGATALIEVAVRNDGLAPAVDVRIQAAFTTANSPRASALTITVPTADHRLRALERLKPKGRIVTTLSVVAPMGDIDAYAAYVAEEGRRSPGGAQIRSPFGVWVAVNYALVDHTTKVTAALYHVDFSGVDLVHGFGPGFGAAPREQLRLVRHPTSGAVAT